MSGQGPPTPRRGCSREEGGGEGAVEVTVHIAAAGGRGRRVGQHRLSGEAGSLQLPRGLKPVLDQADSRHLIAVGAPDHCHTAQRLSGHRQRAHPVGGYRAQCVHLPGWPQPGRRAGMAATSSLRSKPLGQLPGCSAEPHSTPSGPAQGLSVLVPAAPMSSPPPSLRPFPCSLHREGAPFELRRGAQTFWVMELPRPATPCSKRVRSRFTDGKPGPRVGSGGR